MFFTIDKKKNVLIYLHNFSARNTRLISELREVLASCNYVWVTKETDEWWRSCGIADSEIFKPESATEAVLFQNVLRRTMTKLNMLRSETLLLCTSPQVVECATKILIGSIVLKIDPATTANEIDQYGVDFSFQHSQIAAIGDVINGNIVGYASEFFASPTACRVAPLGSKDLLIYDRIDNAVTGTKDYHGGRYFSSKDSRHDLHPLSLRIIDSKKNQRQAETFRRTFAFLIHCATQGNFDLIAHVPAKPGDTKDRFIPFLSGIENEPELKSYKISPAQIRNDLLTCPKGYESLKKFKAALRPQIIKGAFRAHNDVSDKRIILLDDVRTTGSTINECTKTLLEKGAKEVIPITLAYKPIKNFVLPGLCDTPAPTGCCDWPHVVRFNGNNGEPFYGCSAWHAGDLVTHKTSTFSKIRGQMLIDSTQELMTFDKELESWPDY